MIRRKQQMGVTDKIKREKEDDTQGETEENSQREEKG